MAHPFKGIPRAEWPRLMAERKAKEAVTANVPMGDNIAAGLSEMMAAPKASSTPIAPPRNLFSGDIKKLEVFGKNGDNKDPIPGYRLYWFLDRDGTGSRLFQAKQSGYEFVTHGEVALNEQGNSDMGSQVRIFGGATGPNNAPVYHYLMKKPMWLHEQHQLDMQKVPDRIEYELKRGILGKKDGDGRYTAGPGSNLPEINISQSNR